MIIDTAGNDSWSESKIINLSSHGDWKVEANNRIEQIRKRNTKITVISFQGQPLSNMEVKIKQIKHDFAFGSAINMNVINNAELKAFFKSHFEWAVMDNDAKWELNEKEQGVVSYASADSIYDFCSKNEIKMRGHCLFWADPDHVQYWVKNLPNDLLWAAITNRLNDVVNHFKNKFLHWDVNNEMLHFSFFEDRLGETVTKYMFDYVNKLDENCKLFVNDYNIINGGWDLDGYKTQIKELLELDVPIHAIGVQCHMNHEFVNPEEIIIRFESLAELGLPIWVTEFDVDAPSSIDGIDEEKHAQYLEDFYRIAFSLPYIDGILMWGFWEGDHWRINRGEHCYILKKDIVDPATGDWFLNKAGKKYEALLWGEWTTPEFSDFTDSNGVVSFRGFHGTYEVMITGPGVTPKVLIIELDPGLGNAEFQVPVFAVDSDGDGVPDSEDAFPGDPIEWLDTDKDGIGNNVDLDDDNDSMPDEWEKQYDGLNPIVNDAEDDLDQDNYKNYIEYMWGTDPTDSNSTPVAKVTNVVVNRADSDGGNHVTVSPYTFSRGYYDRFATITNQDQFNSCLQYIREGLWAQIEVTNPTMQSQIGHLRIQMRYLDGTLHEIEPDQNFWGFDGWPLTVTPESTAYINVPIFPNTKDTIVDGKYEVFFRFQEPYDYNAPHILIEVKSDLIVQPENASIGKIVKLDFSEYTHPPNLIDYYNAVTQTINIIVAASFKQTGPDPGFGPFSYIDQCDDLFNDVRRAFITAAKTDLDVLSTAHNQTTVCARWKDTTVYPANDFPPQIIRFDRATCIMDLRVAPTSNFATIENLELSQDISTFIDDDGYKHTSAIWWNYAVDKRLEWNQWYEKDITISHTSNIDIIFIVSLEMGPYRGEPGIDSDGGIIDYAFWFSNPDDVYWISVSNHMDTVHAKGTGIQNIDDNNLVINQWGNVSFDIVAPTDGNYYIKVFNANLLTPEWEWSITESSSRALDAGSISTFSFDVLPDTKSEIFQFWLYRQSWIPGLFFVIDKVVHTLYAPLPSNNNPYKPILFLPIANQTNVVLKPELQTEGFSDQDRSDIHTKTEWQISTEPDFSTYVLDVISNSYLTRLIVSESILNEDTTYYWRVRFYDDHDGVSKWADPFSFKTGTSLDDINENGIPDNQEVDNTVDLDNNGNPDVEQTDIKCVKAANGAMQIGVKCPANVASFESVKSIDSSTFLDTGNKPDIMPFGLISIRININNPGDTIDLKIYLNEAASNDAKWYKYDTIDGWKDYSDYTTFSIDRKTIILSLKDGGHGDADKTVNGIIVDPSGLGIKQKSPNKNGNGCFIETLIRVITE